MTNDAPPYFFIPEWPVYYEDNHLLALYKPSGLLVQADRTEDLSLLDLARAWIKQRYQKPGRVYLGLVHRLDRPVAGVLLFARTSKAAGRLSDQFRRKTVEKRYVAVVEGRLEPSNGRLVHHLERIPGRSSRIVSGKTARSQEVRLAYRVMDSGRSRSLVEIDLETGRHHQIRAQLAHIGNPVVGDLRYGAPEPLPDKQVALFARSLTIEHPVSKEILTLESPYPRNWPWPADLEEPGSPPWNWSELSARIPVL